MSAPCQRCHDRGFIAEGQRKGHHPCDRCGKDGAAPRVAPRCDHDYQRSGFRSGPGLIEYECTRCGDTYDRDVS